jgi:hypothetical protein
MRGGGLLSGFLSRSPWRFGFRDVPPAALPSGPTRTQFAQRLEMSLQRPTKRQSAGFRPPSTARRPPPRKVVVKRKIIIRCRKRTVDTHCFPIPFIVKFRSSSIYHCGDLQQMGLRRDRVSESEGKPPLSGGRATTNAVEDKVDFKTINLRSS